MIRKKAKESTAGRGGGAPDYHSEVMRKRRMKEEVKKNI